MRVLDLFSGIGGFALGLEACGMETVAFCERDPYARGVLARHWPGTPIYDDVRTLTAARLEADGVGPIDLICGGFPCQDISCAGKGRGIAEGTRSGLWSEYARLVDELRPRWVVAENVSALRTRGADRVLGGLEALGYSARPLVVGAVHAGAPHERRRVWILANSDGVRFPAGAQDESLRPARAAEEGLPDRLATPRGRRDEPHRPAPPRPGSVRGTLRRRPAPTVWRRSGAHPQPYVRRVADGLPEAMDRLRCTGNAVVPQVVEFIGRAILSVEDALAAGAA